MAEINKCDSAGRSLARCGGIELDKARLFPSWSGELRYDVAWQSIVRSVLARRGLSGTAYYSSERGATRFGVTGHGLVGCDQPAQGKEI